jgi:CRISPR/Cas system-associated exonuclease Cas4 (RecB family)
MTKNEILQTIQLRQSTIKDFLACPLMFRFRHLDKVPPEFRNPAALHGSTLHKLLYLIHLDKWNLDVTRYYRDIFEEFENGVEHKIPVRWENRVKELAASEENAVEILDGYRRKPENRDCLVLYSEQLFRVRIAGHIFTGTIDQIRKNQDDSLELIDFKSGKQQPNPTALKNDWQLALYSYAARHGEFDIAGKAFKPKISLDYASIYFLRGHEIRKKASSNGPAGLEKSDPLLRLNGDQMNTGVFKDQTSQLLKSMLKDWHYPNPTHCNMCQYTGYCLNRSKELPKSLVKEARQRLLETALVA